MILPTDMITNLFYGIIFAVYGIPDPDSEDEENNQ